jgi:diguanylate cyclase (GGDEF)-like protein/PAS domain S-box-containing protein
MNSNLASWHGRRSAALIDFLIIGILGSVLYLISVQTEAHLIIDQWAEGRRFLGLKLNEFIVVFAFLGIAFSIFSLRRWNELNCEITEREKSEKKLLESEEKFRNLAEKSLTGIYLVQDGVFKYVNPLLAELFGYTVEELTDKMGPSDVVFPEDLPVVRENLRKRVSGEIKAIHYSFRVIRKDKEIIHVSVYGTRTQYRGSPAVIGTLLDITERRQKAEALRQSEERYRNLVDNARDIIFTLSTDGKFTSLNPVFEILTGWSGSAWLGKPFVPLLHPDEAPLVVESFQRALRGEIPPTLELRILSEQGEYLMFEITSTPFISDGKVISVLGIARDITGRKRIEENLVRQSCEIAIKNMELSTLYKISSAISQTINMQSLFKNILNTITEMDTLKVQRRAGIFIVEGEKLILTAHLGHPEEFLALHKNITIHDCLCGLAARTGEIIISKNCHTDCSHIIVYSDMAPHGHIIIPLKTADRTVGVLYLYLLPDAEVRESVITMLTTIGNQIGMAISNSVLFEETKRLSLLDPLTGLANRRCMNIEFERNLARARRFGNSFSIILLDIDNFKNFNDAYGHTKGDRLLADIGKILSNAVRGLDLVARFGGEEFLILLPETELAIACKVAERIRKSVEAKTSITLSLGVTSCSSGIYTIEDFIKRADDALYQAKQKGKNRVEVGV